MKTRCENCSRLMICEPVKQGARNFCSFECRLNWVRAQRRFEVSLGAAGRVRRQA